MNDSVMRGGAKNRRAKNRKGDDSYKSYLELDGAANGSLPFSSSHEVNRYLTKDFIEESARRFAQRCMTFIDNSDTTGNVVEDYENNEESLEIDQSYLTIFAKRIRASRLAQKITIEELGERACINPRTLILLESDMLLPSEVTPSMQAKLLDILGLHGLDVDVD